MKTKKKLFFVFGISIILGFLVFGRSKIVHALVFIDGFESPDVNINRWRPAKIGTGMRTQQINGRLEMQFDSTATNEGNYAFIQEFASVCKLRGDFDIQVDFSLLEWPNTNGVRVGLAATNKDFAFNDVGVIERDSFGSGEFFSLPKEVYITDYAIGSINGGTEARENEGKLRLIRLGSIMNAYFYRDGGWVLVHSGPVIKDDVGYALAAWSHNDVFSGQNVRIAFDNFIITSGQLACPIPTATPTVTPTPSPGVILFKQDDPKWGSDIYASADKQKLRCGATLAQCGCAVTSAAMVLDYHGAKKDPLTGNPTTPETVNNYFKSGEKCSTSGICISTGYKFGDVFWPAIGKYSADAHSKYGTQKIEWVGASSYDPVVVVSDLLSRNPVILKVLRSSHWATAVSVIGDTFGLNDPVHNITKLSDSPYNNNAFYQQRFKKTSSDFSVFEASSLSPAQVLITDSSGRKTGFDPFSQTVLTEIPSSYYYFDEEISDDTKNSSGTVGTSGVYTAIIKTPHKDTFNVQVISPDEQQYDLAVYGSDRDAGLSYELFEETPVNSQSDKYIFHYSPEPGEKSIVLNIPIDIKPESDLNPIKCEDKNGMIPVAILSANTFNALDVDADSVEFEGAKEAHVDKLGSAVRHVEDVNGDGKEDLIFHFSRKDMKISCDETSGIILGKTSSGLAISGTDAIKIK